MRSAEQSFLGLEDEAEWIVAAGEISAAFAANGQSIAARDYVSRAQQKIDQLESSDAKISASAALAKDAVTAKLPDLAERLVTEGELAAANIADNAKKYDLSGKLAVVRASIGQFDRALKTVRAFPETTSNHQAFKARSLREIAVELAKAGKWTEADLVITEISFGLTYYQSTVRSDIAHLAFSAGDFERAVRLLQEAEEIARAQENGYFVAGALRDIGVAYVNADMRHKAMSLFTDAIAGARRANSYQEKARAMSRIATGMADCGLYRDTQSILQEAEQFAQKAKSDLFRQFSYYEIAGSAAFSGQFSIADRLVTDLPETQFGSTSSLRAAALRDIAWGFAKHGRNMEARKLVSSIKPARERIMSISRIVRLMKNPKLEAFPRYL
ncbi:MAG: hypothetical protein ABJO01_12550 [Parasphingorhabdus sp.]|uniref:hypothetical protein n=1 Tax=Parasphingorhabdus sp. TaxID=2709688 RepID=UPI0032993529